MWDLSRHPSLTSWSGRWLRNPHASSLSLPLTPCFKALKRGRVRGRKRGCQRKPEDLSFSFPSYSSCDSRATAPEPLGWSNHPQLVGRRTGPRAQRECGIQTKQSLETGAACPHSLCCALPRLKARTCPQHRVRDVTSAASVGKRRV